MTVLLSVPLSSLPFLSPTITDQWSFLSAMMKSVPAASIVSADCVKRKKNHRRKEKSTLSPHVSSTVDHEERNDNKMTLLERIALLDREDWTPEHTELECPLYEQCQHCRGTGAYGFIRNHTCTPTKEEEDTGMNMVNEADFDLYWGVHDN
ncbi:hypothetical protein EDB89DRAFT_1916868 [Lactarius sanguifluus]|nr:hypothetical protein EDB89DRAFT_1916868 [Lactarius sanguifluus]